MASDLIDAIAAAPRDAEIRSGRIDRRENCALAVPARLVELAQAKLWRAAGNRSNRRAVARAKPVFGDDPAGSSLTEHQAGA